MKLCQMGKECRPLSAGMVSICGRLTNWVPRYMAIYNTTSAVQGNSLSVWPKDQLAPLYTLCSTTWKYLDNMDCQSRVFQLVSIHSTSAVDSTFF